MSQNEPGFKSFKPNFERNESDLKNDPCIESDSSKPALEDESEWIMIVRIKYI